MNIVIIEGLPHFQTGSRSIKTCHRLSIFRHLQQGKGNEFMDKYEIVELSVNELSKCESFWDNGGNSDDSRLANLMKCGERKAFACKTDDGYVGGCAISIRNNDHGEYGHFSYFSVRNNLRSRGIGSSILDFAVNYLKEIGIKTMRLNVYKDNPSAIRLYKRNGFIYDKDLTPEKIIMVKNL
ncbi:GNAT family N-acetyltransferase [bacterium]|nr:GNAT family N-acetyltransferase [bacterium]